MSSIKDGLLSADDADHTPFNPTGTVPRSDVQAAIEFGAGGGGPGGAVADDAEFLVRIPHSDLTNERVVQDSETILWNWSTLGAVAATWQFHDMEQLAAPIADRGVFWDVSEGGFRYWQPGTALGFVGSQLSVTNPELVSIAALESAADKLPYFTGPSEAALTDLTALARDLIGASTDIEMRDIIGVGEFDSYVEQARQWAENPEDDDVDGNPGHFSSLHWSAKSEGHADDAETAKTAAEAAAVSTAADAIATAADRVQTGLDVVATAADRVQTGLDAAATAADAIATAADAVATAADRVQTGLDAVSASSSAGTATTQAGISTTQAGIATTQAGIATTQAGTATTQAGNAATSAGNAATSESNAATSASNALTSENNAAASESAAAASEANAATSEANAATSESNAATSEGNAATSAANALTSEGNAATSESNAANSETNAANSAAAAAASFDAFDDIYLGSKASDPTLDNDGDPLVEGQIYWNNVSNNLRIYDGAAWQSYSPTGGITAIVQDTSPQLGGNLDLNSFVITGLEIGTDVQAHSLNLDSWSAVAPSSYLTTGDAASTYQPLASALTSLASASANGISLVTTADYAAMRGLLDLEVGVDVQAYSANLASWSAVTPSDYLTTTSAASSYQPLDSDLTAWAGVNPSAYYNASQVDSAIGGAITGLGSVYQPLDSDLTAIAALTTTAAGRTSLTFADPNADRIMAWDDSAGSGGAVVPIALPDIATESTPEVGDFVLGYRAEGDFVKIDVGNIGGGLDLEDLMDLVDPTAASESSNQLTMNVDDGNNLYFQRVLGGHAEVQTPIDMPAGATISLLIDPTVHPTTAPAIAERSSGGTSTTDTDTHPVTLPSTTNPGDLIVVVFSADQNPTVDVNTSVSGNNWRKLGQASQGSDVTGAIFWKIAEGSDALTVTTSNNQQSTHICFRITGVMINATDFSGTSATGSSTNANPPSHTPPNGTQNYLVIATHSSDAQVVASAAPSGYGNLTTQTATGSNGASTSVADRTAASISSEDPGVFTTANEQWVAWTLMIGPYGIYMVDWHGSYAAPVPTIDKESLVQIQNLGGGRYVAVTAWEAE